MRTLLPSLSLLVSSASAMFSAKAWQSMGQFYTWPENSISSIVNKKSTGITFSGGGDRAYISAIGYLAGLHELGFIGNI